MALLKLKQRAAATVDPPPPVDPPPGDYPAVVASLGLEDVYDLHPDRTGTGCRIATASLKTTPVAGDSRLPDGATYDATNFRFILAGNYTGTRRTFSGWNCKAAGAYIEIVRPGWTVEDCLVGPSKVAGGVFTHTNYPIKISNVLANSTPGDDNSNTIIQYNSIDGLHTDGTYHITSAAIIVMNVGGVDGVIIRRNYLTNMGADGINVFDSDDTLIEYNFIDIGGRRVGAHFDHLQFFGGDGLIYRRNYLNSVPSNPSHGRTNMCRLECFPSNTSITNALIEHNYHPGGEQLDIDGLPQFYTMDVALEAGTGVTNTSTSGNQFNHNAVSHNLATIHPSSTGVTGTGNRKVVDNSLIADFTFPPGSNP